MSDKLNLSGILKYIKSLINFNQIKTPKAKGAQGQWSVVRGCQIDLS